MEPSIADLLQLADDRLFEEISEGVAHIVENAENLDSIAVRLDELGELRGAGILRALAAEESAKILILLDVVRCPVGDRECRSSPDFSHEPVGGG